MDVVSCGLREGDRIERERKRETEEGEERATKSEHESE